MAILVVQGPAVWVETGYRTSESWTGWLRRAKARRWARREGLQLAPGRHVLGSRAS